MKAISSLVLWVLLSPALVAQEKDKIVVAVKSVTGVNFTNYDALSNATNIIQSAFSEKQRFITVDRSKISDLAGERDLQKNEEFINGKMAEQGRSLGADYIVSGTLSSLNATPIRVQQKNYQTNQNYYVTQYEGSINLSLTLIDVATGATKSNTINYKAGKKLLGVMVPSKYDTDVEAFNATMGSLKGYVQAWINDLFPETMKIIRVESSNKKGGAETVLVKGGSESSLAKGSKLTVFLSEDIVIDNETLHKEKKIGELKVQEIQGTNLSICKITDGENEIQDAMNNNKTMIIKIAKY